MPFFGFMLFFCQRQTTDKPSAPDSRPRQSINKKTPNASFEVSCISLVRLRGLASLEPPAKQSTGLFFCQRQTTDKPSAPNSRPRQGVNKKTPNASFEVSCVSLVRLRGLEPRTP